MHLFYTLRNPDLEGRIKARIARFDHRNDEDPANSGLIEWETSHNLRQRRVVGLKSSKASCPVDQGSPPRQGHSVTQRGGFAETIPSNSRGGSLRTGVGLETGR